MNIMNNNQQDFSIVTEVGSMNFMNKINGIFSLLAAAAVGSMKVNILATV